MALIGYARISTADQDPALQLDALGDNGCEKVFTDEASGALDRRPELDRCLDHLRSGDVLVVWRLDRLGRSVRHLIDVLTDLQTWGRVPLADRGHRHHDPRRPPRFPRFCGPG